MSERRREAAQSEESAPLEVALAIDWKLGQSDRMSAVFLWLIVGGIAAYGLVHLAMGVHFFLRALDDPSLRNLAAAVSAYGFGLGILGFADLARGYLSGGRRGRWGKFVGDLVLRHRAVEFELLGKCEWLPGIRWWMRRRAILLTAPGRLLVVAREWNGWLVAILFAPGLTMAGTLWARGIGSELPPVWPAALGYVLAFFTICRATRIHTLPVLDLGEPDATSQGVRVPVERGPLRPEIELRGKDDATRQRLHDRLAEVLATTAAPADDPALTTLEQLE